MQLLTNPRYVHGLLHTTSLYHTHSPKEKIRTIKGNKQQEEVTERLTVFRKSITVCRLKSMNNKSFVCGKYIEYNMVKTEVLILVSGF